MNTSLFIIFIGSGVCTGVYQKAMLDDESQRYIASRFVEPMKLSEHAEGVHFYSEGEFHITLKRASGPRDLTNVLQCRDENDVENRYNFTNDKLKMTVDNTHEVLRDVTFKIKGMNVFGTNPHRKFLVCEVEPVLDNFDKKKSGRV